MNAPRLILIATLAGLAGCATTKPSGPVVTASAISAPHKSPPPRPARINHVVFFKLKDPAEAPQLVEECNHLLATIPVIVSGWAGTRLDTGRPADAGSDFDVSFYAGFMTQADYDVYLEHPEHVAAAAKWGPHLEWLRIHDVLDDTP